MRNQSDKDDTGTSTDDHGVIASQEKDPLIQLLHRVIRHARLGNIYVLKPSSAAILHSLQRMRNRLLSSRNGSAVSGEGTPEAVTSTGTWHLVQLSLPQPACLKRYGFVFFKPWHLPQGRHSSIIGCGIFPASFVTAVSGRSSNSGDWMKAKSIVTAIMSTPVAAASCVEYICLIKHCSSIYTKLKLSDWTFSNGSPSLSREARTAFCIGSGPHIKYSHSIRFSGR